MNKEYATNFINNRAQLMQHAILNMSVRKY